MTEADGITGVADIPIQLPADTTRLTTDLTERIPKIVIGNPGAQDRIGWDIIPNWRPRLAPGVTVDRNNRVVAGAAGAFIVPADFGTALRLCDGRTFWEICQAWHADNPAADTAHATEDAARHVKAGRVLGLVKWEFTLDNRDGVFFRRRRLGDGPTGHDWFFVPSFTKEVFDLCSGAYSCRELAAELAGRTGREPNRMLGAVLRSCRTLIDIGVVDWIDDTILRSERLISVAKRLAADRCTKPEIDTEGSTLCHSPRPR
jgi:hypothetical protein